MRGLPGTSRTPATAGRAGAWRVAAVAVLLIAGGAVLAMEAVHLAASVWITLAGLAAAVAAYLIALPSGPGRPPQTSRSRDASSRPGSV